MGLETKNPESLHDMSKQTSSPTTGNFVNPGTPAEALATMESTTNPEISKQKSEALRANLTGNTRK